MALREASPASESEVDSGKVTVHGMKFDVIKLLRYAEDQRDLIAEEARAGNTPAPGELDVRRDVLKIHQGWLKEAGIEFLHDEPIAADVLAGGDAEERIDYDQEPELLRRAA